MIAAAAAAFTAMSGLAYAQMQVKATTDLNVRAGPGPHHEVIGVIQANENATLEGCLENSKWCRVTFEGGTGWSYSDYLVADAGGSVIVISEAPATVQVPVVSYEQTSSTSGGGAIAGGTAGAVAGAIIAGPLGAAVGGVAGAAAGGMAEGLSEPPPAEVVTYVEANPVEPVYLEGEVVVGARLPETVEVREIPQYEYRYVYVNGQPVLVEPGTRRIVYVMR
jgi:uncharacterized protein YraI